MTTIAEIRDYFQSFDKGCRIIRRSEFLRYANYLRCSELRYSNGIEDKAETLEEQDKENPHECQRAVPPGSVWTERRIEGEMRKREPQRVGGGGGER